MYSPKIEPTVCTIQNELLTKIILGIRSASDLPKRNFFRYLSYQVDGDNFSVDVSRCASHLTRSELV